MSRSNSPDPAVRAAVVRQDLGNVLHPIVQHKMLEGKQMVVAGGSGSTVMDADGTEYLDGMAGLWCVNIGYGRTELAEVAADQMRQLSYFPHTAMNVPAAALAEKSTGSWAAAITPTSSTRVRRRTKPVLRSPGSI
jgi:taurine-pyruvate aminotransferase